MGIQKQGDSKGGNYVGGFLQMFEWNAKSRKKLFSSKSDIPEQSKLKKICDGNLPMTRLQTLDEDENVAASSSIKESSDYSCGSSVIDEDICGTRAPGVVARLMGLDSFPKSHISDPYSSPLVDFESLQGSCLQVKTQSHVISSRDAPVSSKTGEKCQTVIQKPIEKFRAEVLPPKSARSIPITHHKLLSPIKSANFIPSKDPAQIMEVAARIIEPGPNQATAKMKLRTVGSSSVPLRVRDLKEKVRASQKQPKVFEGSQRKAESCGVKNLGRHSTKPELEEFSVGAMKNQGKSISLALQAKANVQKREGISLNGSRRAVSLKEPCKVSPEEPFKDEPTTTEKSTVKKQCTQNGSIALRPNNQKQNCIINQGKSSSKCSSKGVRESASARQPSLSKVSSTSRISSRNSGGSDIKDDNSEVSSSSTGRITRKKRSIDGKCHSEKSKQSHNVQMDKNRKAAQSSGVTDRQSSRDQGSGGMGMDAISFTFTAPMMRLGPDSSEAAGNSKTISPDSENITSPLSTDGLEFAFPRCNVKGGDALSILLEQKLKELTLKVELSQQKSGIIMHDMEHGQKAVMSSTVQDGIIVENKNLRDIQMLDDGSNVPRARKLLDHRLPSPVSVLEPFSFGDSCNSMDTTDVSDSTAGSKECTLNQALASYSLETCFTIEGDAELSDSASSNSTRTVTKMQEMSIDSVEYVKDILGNIETMFVDYALGRIDKVINPQIFDQLGNQKRCSKNSRAVARLNQRFLFDCVYECLETRCAQYACGGFELWAKGASMIRRRDRLAEEVYKEIWDWSAVGDSMIDELVDQDMSSQYGKWLNFDRESFELGVQIESCVLNALVDEIVEDMLV